MRARIAAALGERALAIEHAGSTSVPGLASKPIVDIVVLVDSLDAPLVESLESIGLEYVPPEVAGLPFRRYFRRHPDEELAPGVAHSGYHVHVYEAGNTPDGLLEFRDYLRAHPEAAAEYEALKRGLAERHPDDRAAYTEGKGEFIAAALARSRAGASPSGV
jgi:GrpB-like predicted nucleotidyltransferase (UPF0157 family)